jgi:uncharacterized phage protein gp47/JayE
MAEYQYVTATGVIVPDTENIYAEVQAEYLAVFGQDILITPDTPQGVLATSDALARAEVVQNNAALANQINPNVAGGVFLDAIMALTGVQRTAATRTVVPGVTLNGVTGTVIPAGTRASTAVGVLFESLVEVTLVSGTATVDFRAVDYGPLACGIGELNQVVSNVNGWETVTNPNAGVLGQDTQSDQGARAKRNNTLAFQGVGLPEAITSALYNVEGVNSLFFQENIAGTTEVINGITMVRNSIWVCVDGGSDTDVAAALLENKSLGCAWNGTEIVSLIEPASGQTYQVKFERPAPIQFLVRVTSPNGDTQDIQNAVVAWATGLLSGMEGLKVGTDVSPFEIAAGINAVYPAIYVSKVEIAPASSPTSWSTDVLAIAVDELAYTTASDVSVITP